MKTRKAENVDVDKRSGFYFRVGLVLSLAFSILAFEWTSYEKNNVQLNSGLVLDEEEDLADITKQEKPPEAAPPPPQVATEIEIVEDDVKIDENQADLETEFDENKAIIPIDDDKETAVEEEIFKVVEDNPTFPGGEQALFEYLSKNIKYPEIERDNGIQGLVVVSFVVEKDGSVSKMEILKGVTPNINEEAIRVVKDMPKWNPGKQRGKAVRVNINLPIRFTLQ